MNILIKINKQSLCHSCTCNMPPRLSSLLNTRSLIPLFIASLCSSVSTSPSSTTIFTISSSDSGSSAIFRRLYRNWWICWIVCSILPFSSVLDYSILQTKSNSNINYCICTLSVILSYMLNIALNESITVMNRLVVSLLYVELSSYPLLWAKGEVD
jgi:hypothetical protein